MIRFYFISVLLILIFGTGVRAGHIFCLTDGDCIPISKSHCDISINTCVCNDGLIYSRDFERCLPVPESPSYICEDVNQCTAVIAGQVDCIRGRCACERGYRFARDECVRTSVLGDVCYKSQECMDGATSPDAMECVNGKCQCSPGWYNRDGYDCRPISKVGEPCVIYTDCPSTSRCNQTSQTCENYQLNKIKDYDEKTQQVPEPITNTNHELNQNCSQMHPCMDDNSFCAGAFGKCFCKPGYVAYEKKCVPGLGELCTTPMLPNFECVFGVSQCNKWYFIGDTNEQCHKPARKINDSCTHDRNCYTFGPNAICANNKCTCADGYKFDQVKNLCYRSAENNCKIWRHLHQN